MPSSLPAATRPPLPRSSHSGAPAAVFRARPGMAGLARASRSAQASAAWPARARATAAAATPGFGSPRGVDMAPEGAGPPRASRPIPRSRAAPRPHSSPEALPGLPAGAAVRAGRRSGRGKPGEGCVCVMGRGLGNGGAAWEGLAGAPLSPNRTRPRIPATAAPPASSPSPISSRAPGTYPSIAEPDKASLPRTEPRSQRATRAARKWRPGPDGNCRRCRSARGSARRRKEPSARAPGGGGRRAAGHRDRGSGRLRRWLPPPARPPARALAPALRDVPAAVAGWLVGWLGGVNGTSLQPAPCVPQAGPDCNPAALRLLPLFFPTSSCIITSTHKGPIPGPARGPFAHSQP